MRGGKLTGDARIERTSSAGPGDEGRWSRWDGGRVGWEKNGLVVGGATA